MAINGLDQTSMEQLMAIALMSNGQLTNDSTSTNASSETSYAFQLLMQSYLEKAKNDSSESTQNAVNASGATSESQTSSDSSSSSSDAMSDLVNLSSSKQVQQNYSAGQNLLDIPLVTNESNNTYSSVSSVSSADNLSSILNSSNNSDTMSRIYAAVKNASEKYGVSANLILAVIKQESDFNPTDVSSAGAQGLMQLMPCNVSSLGISDPYNIEQNIDGGTRLLKEGLDQYNGDLTMTLMAYNAGSGTMQNRGVTSASDLYKMPAETRNYVPKVLGYYQNGI